MTSYINALYIRFKQSLLKHKLTGELTELRNQMEPLRDLGLVPSTASVPLPRYATIYFYGTSFEEHSHWFSTRINVTTLFRYAVECCIAIVNDFGSFNIFAVQAGKELIVTSSRMTALITLAPMAPPVRTVGVSTRVNAKRDSQVMMLTSFCKFSLPKYELEFSNEFRFVVANDVFVI